MKNWAKSSPISAAAALVGLGFIVLFLGWNGAAGVDFVPGQVPYLISGGLVGIGLIGSGLAVMVINAHRRDTQQLLQKLDELADRLGGEQLQPNGLESERARRARELSGGARPAKPRARRSSAAS